MVKIIDGKMIAERIRAGLKMEAEILKVKGIIPKLVVVLIGEDPASQTYVRMKEKGCAEIGILSESIRKPAETTEQELLQIIDGLNKDDSVSGILAQMPLPKHINEAKVVNAINSAKDVDGLGIENAGKLFKGEKGGLRPCTPEGVIELILSTGLGIIGKEAVVVGRSILVGKPVAMLLLEQQATVTICHSKTKDLGSIIKRADILVAAIGKAKMIKADMIKLGAVVIDVGTSRVGDKLVGDVDFEEAQKVAGFITPVPGGVGPMTIAMLLKNVIAAASRK